MSSKIIPIVLFSVSVYAQEGWYYQNPVPTSCGLKSVQFVNADTGWAIGSSGTIIHTANGGETWELQYANMDGIKEIFFVDYQYGWAVGWKFTDEYVWGIPRRDNMLLKTENGGNNWTVQAKLEGGSFAGDLFFIDRKIGWLACPAPYDQEFNSLIMKTIDGGESWTVQDNVGHKIHDLYFLNDQTGWAVGGWSSAFNVTILKTEDGGQNWIWQAGGVHGVLSSIFFIDDDTGWAVGTDNIIIKTDDGGSHWVKQSAGNNLTNRGLNSVFFTSANKGFICGGYFLTTQNGGENWAIESNLDPSSIFFINAQTGWCVGNGGLIQKTTDAGESWEHQSKSFTTDYLTHVDFVDEYNGWVICSKSIYHTQNGGASWEMQKYIPPVSGTDLPDPLQYIFAMDKLNCWIVGYDLQDTSALILHTADGGNRWNKQPVQYNAPLHSAYFCNQNSGWVVGDSGLILYTENGGQRWSKQESGIAEYLSSVDFIDSKHGWIATNGGTILHTQNGGENWSIQIQGFDPLYAIDFIDSTGWCVGGYSPNVGPVDDTILRDHGYIYRSSNGGHTWERQYEDYSRFYSVKFINEDVGFVIGKDVLFTEDGGRNWIKQRIPISQARSIDFVGNSHGWLVGHNGSIMHMSNGGITSIDDPNKTPYTSQNIILYQNYPNPFNPTTTISFVLPKMETARIEVFNSIGQKVATLFDKQTVAGFHEVILDAQNLPSGIYIYRIVAGDFISKKKCLLLK